MSSPRQPDTIELGTLRGVRFLMSETTWPWDLGVDTLIVEGASGTNSPGHFGRLLSQQFPGPPWEVFETGRGTTERRHLQLNVADVAEGRQLRVALAVDLQQVLDGDRGANDAATVTRDVVRYACSEAGGGTHSVGLPFLYHAAKGSPIFSTLKAVVDELDDDDNAFGNQISESLSMVVMYTTGAAKVPVNIRNHWASVTTLRSSETRTLHAAVATRLAQLDEADLQRLLDELPDQLPVDDVADRLQVRGDALRIWLSSLGEDADRPAYMVLRSTLSKLLEESASVQSVPRYSTERLAGGLTRDLVDANEYIPMDRDHLGVAPYVSMLATVIAAKDTPLPLSVGLFGEWGSGKSYFMGMLRGQVKALEASPGYCGKIAQIGFNAWHYADANLWASLGDEIFRQLAEPRRRPGESHDDHEARQREGAQLREQVAAALEQRQQLTAVTQRAEAEAAAVQRKITEAEQNRKFEARRVLWALRRSETARKTVDKVWTALGVDDEVEQGRLLAEQLRGTLSEGDELRRTSRYRFGRIALVLAGFVLLVGVCASVLVPPVKEWLAGVGVVVGGLLATGVTLFGWARAGLRRLRTLAEELHRGMANTPQEELYALERVEAEQRVAEAQLTEVVARIGELGRQLAELTPGRRMYAFLAERHHSEDYRGQLGLISTIRKDFENLVALMTPQPGDDPDVPRPVDRIVLYIDDLDRCSPQQVVEVLQAVHLLLAFDLFVVVVGVDPRWLLRSISSHYDQLIESEPAVRGDDWHISPEDYLQKILNIPLVLPRMPTGGLKQLLQSMIHRPDEHAAAAAPLIVERRMLPGERFGEALFVTPFPDNTMQVDEGSQVATQLDPRQPPEIPQPLTDAEIDLLSQLDELVETPRDAKRLLNLYRMVRATRDLSEASAFLGWEYQAVIVLLGTLAAHARLHGRFAGALLRTASGTRWTDFLATLKPEMRDDHWASASIGRIVETEVPQWEHLHDSLLKLSQAITLEEVQVFQTWIPRIRPFSYVLTPAGSARTSPRQPGTPP
jgi:hypothetical protein